MTRAQSPREAARSPLVSSASLGYSYTNASVPSSGRIALNGANATITIDAIPRLETRLDVGYVRSSNVLHSGSQGDILSYLVGPVFYPVRHRKQTVFVQGLLGGARVRGPLPVGGRFLTGYVNHLAWAIGTGAEYAVHNSIGFRIGADYLHTNFFNSATVIKGQNDLRITVSFVFLFGRHAR